MQRRRSFLVLGGVAVVAVAALIYVRYGVEEGAEPLTLYGNVDIRQVDMGFRVFGRVDRMAVEEGDPVTRGEVLATLDAAPYRAEVDAAAATVAARAADLERLHDGYRKEDIAKARADLAARTAVLANAQHLLERREALRRSGAISAQSYDDTLYALRQAAAERDSAAKSLDLMLAGYRREDIAAAAAELDQAKADLALAQTHLSDTVLKAPEDGTVLTRVVEPGAMVAAGGTVYTLTLRNPVRIRAFIAETALGRVRPGMAAEVRTDSFPGRVYPAQVGYISPRAEFTPKSVETPDLRTDLVYRLRLIVQDPKDELRQGMPVTVTFPGVAASGEAGR